MDKAPLFLAVLLVGAALGWLAHHLVEEGDEPSVAVTERLPVGQEDRGVGLALREAERALPPVRELEGTEFDSASRAERGLRSLLDFYAWSGREADFHRLVAAALAAGADADDVLEAIRRFPRERRGAVLDAVMAAHPQLAFDAYDAARVFERAGDAQRALSMVRDALPKMRKFDGAVARMLLRLDPDHGLQSLYDLESSKSWDGRTLAKLMGQLAESERHEAIIPFLKRAVAELGDEEALDLLGYVDPHAALALARDRLEIDAQDATAWLRLGELQRAVGDERAAFEALVRVTQLEADADAFQQLIEIDPQRALPLVEAWAGQSLDDEELGTLAAAYASTGQTAKAIEVYARAFEHDPDDSEWIEGLVALDADRAAALIAKRLERSPGSATDELLGDYGDALRAAGRTEDAFVQYVEAHRKDADDAEWQVAMANADARRALAVLDEHVRAHPDDASGRGARGIALARLGKEAEALRELSHALANGDPERWYEEYARIDPAAAMQGLRRRAGSDRRARTWGVLARAAERAGDIAGARDAYRRALAEDPRETDWIEALQRLR